MHARTEVPDIDGAGYCIRPQLTKYTHTAPANIEVEDWDAFRWKQRSLFSDLDAMKKNLRDRLTKPEYNVSMYYKSKGIAQKIARSDAFEHVVLTVISLNALWIFVDIDYNPSDVLAKAPIVFQLVEQFFCFFFVIEWAIRFSAFKRKLDGFRDCWFVFDSLLLLVYVADSWFVYLYMKSSTDSRTDFFMNASLLRLVRLVRLTRMAKMAHVLNEVPELTILIRGLGAGMRSVAVTLVLLFTLIYVFAIVFRAFCDEDAPFCSESFSSVPQSGHTLLIHGTLMDNLGDFVHGLQEYSLALMVLFYIFLVLAAVTIMNMLIGVLCDVVNNTAEIEKEALSIQFVNKQLQAIMRRAGLGDAFDGEAKINKREFLELLHNPEAAALFEQVGVDPVSLLDFSDFIFKDDLPEVVQGNGRILSFTDFVEVVLQLRGDNGATVGDIVGLRKYLQLRFSNVETKLDAIASSILRCREGQYSTWSSVEQEEPGIVPSHTSSTQVSQTASKAAMDDCTIDTDRAHSAPRGSSPTRFLPCTTSTNKAQAGQHMETVRENSDELCGTADVKHGTRGQSNGSDFRHLVHRLVLEHDSALASMQRHNERLHAELNLLKSPMNPRGTNMQRHDDRLQEELNVAKSLQEGVPVMRGPQFVGPISQPWLWQPSADDDLPGEEDRRASRMQSEAAEGNAYMLCEAVCCEVDREPTQLSWGDPSPQPALSDEMIETYWKKKQGLFRC